MNVGICGLMCSHVERQRRRAIPAGLSRNAAYAPTLNGPRHVLLGDFLNAYWAFGP